MLERIDLDRDNLIQILSTKIAQAAVREAQMESAIQSQAQQIEALQGHIAALTADVEQDD